MCFHLVHGESKIDRIDPQSTKTQSGSEERGIDGGKKVRSVAIFCESCWDIRASNSSKLWRRLLPSAYRRLGTKASAERVYDDTGLDT